MLAARLTSSKSHVSREKGLNRKQWPANLKPEQPLVRQQLEDQLGIGKGIIRSAIDSAVSAIDYWKNRPLKNAAAGAGFPPPDNLIPVNATAAVEHARRIAPHVAQELSSAFDDLRNAMNEIERITAKSTIHAVPRRQLRKLFRVVTR